MLFDLSKVVSWVGRSYLRLATSNMMSPPRVKRGTRRHLIRLTLILFLCLVGVARAQNDESLLLPEDRYVVTIVHRISIGPGLDDPVTSLLERSGCAEAALVTEKGGPQWILRAKSCRFSADIHFVPNAMLLTVARAVPEPRIVQDCNFELTPLGRALHWLPTCAKKPVLRTSSADHSIVTRDRYDDAVSFLPSRPKSQRIGHIAS